jgi:hypothetical protein
MRSASDSFVRALDKFTPMSCNNLNPEITRRMFLTHLVNIMIYYNIIAPHCLLLNKYLLPLIGRIKGLHYRTFGAFQWTLE